eukprot:jgi/Mesvir1/2412/Mv22150-RA.1
MIHELLLALLGHTGDVFIDIDERSATISGGKGPNAQLRRVRNPQDVKFMIAPDLTFIHESERSVLNRLVRAGYYYRELEHFMTTERLWDCDDGMEVSGMGTMYRRALAVALSQVLAGYRNDVVELEQSALRDPTGAQPVLSRLQQGLAEHEIQLRALHTLVWEVQWRGMRGGQVLSLLHAKSHTGNPLLQDSMHRLLWHCHQVMYKQLAGWVLHGLLLDKYGEFFIRRKGPVGPDGAEQVPDPFNDDQMLEQGAGGDGAGGAGGGSVTGASGGSRAVEDWHKGFGVHMEMLPAYLPLGLVEDLLFIGKSVRVLRHPNARCGARTKDAWGGAGASAGASSWDDERAGDGSGGGWGGDDDMVADGGGDEELLPAEETRLFAAALRELQAAPSFHLLSLERVVQAIRSRVSHRLWKLVVVHANLPAHLRTLKDYFLLAKGDFYQCFFEESRALMRMPPRPATAEADLNVPFQQAALKTTASEDKYFPRVKFRLTSATVRPGTTPSGSASAGGTVPTGGAGPGDGGSSAAAAASVPRSWDAITLEYKVDWPLHMLLTPEALDRYNTVFQFLMRLKRVQILLEAAWKRGMTGDRSGAGAGKGGAGGSGGQSRRGQRMAVWRLRHHMTYLITNLQYYIQVDVIEVQYGLLQERVRTSEDFHEVMRAHQEYTTALVSQTFLDIDVIAKLLNEIVGQAQELCKLIESEEGGGDMAVLDQLAQDFSVKSNSLYTTLRSNRLAGSKRAPVLRQFLLRLNYNDFFQTFATKTLTYGKRR